eukprot:7736825-Pyramimonas_sp.AAC.1
MIEKLLDEVDPLAVAVLINAVYFKGEWANKFDKNDTRKMDFHLAGGTSVPCKVSPPVVHSPTHQAAYRYTLGMYATTVAYGRHWRSD